MDGRDYPQAEEGDFVDGIFNYCDRWCERCTLTHRCRQFAMSATMDAVEGLEDEFPEAKMDPADFWKPFDEAGGFAGLDWNEEDPDSWLEDGEEVEGGMRRKEQREDDRKHPCSVESMRYLEQVREWLESRREDLEKRGLMVDFEAGARRSLHADRDVERLRDAIDVVTWYHLQIYVKLQRALESRRTEAETPEEYRVDDNGDPFPSDADGSAKVAIIGVDRSLAAWSLLRDGVPEEGEGIFEILLCLDGVRRQVEREFPRARAFRRPGFDE